MFKRTSQSIAAMAFFMCLATPLAAAENPYLKPNETWISINGTVESVSRDTFMLDYGEGHVQVEMDDGDRDADAYKLLKGDKVTVSGMVDKDFYETTSIEAASVYVENIGTYFFSSAVDEEDSYVTFETPIIVSSTAVIKGTVSKVNDDSFMLSSGSQKIKVEVDEMAYNPLDKKGYQKIREGDLVSVSGQVDNELFDGRVFNAHSIVTIQDNSKSDSG